MKCSNCGAENVNDARFCFNCGSSIASDSQPRFTIDQTQDIPEIQPEYVSEQPQYGYGQNQYLNEQSDKPEKSSKKGVIIAILVTVLVLLIAGVVGYLGYTEGWFDKNDDTQAAEEVKGPVLISVAKDKLYKTGNVELWLANCKRYEGAVKPSNADEYYDGPLTDIPGSKYFVVSIRVKNVLETDIDFDNIYLAGSLDDKYDLNDYLEVYYESDDGTAFVNDSIIEPDETGTVYFVCSVPDTYADSYKKMTVSFGFDSEFSSKPYTKGKDACDYIFEVVAVK